MKREIVTSLFMRSMKNLNLNDFSHIKQVHGQIMLRETKLALYRELELRNRLFQEDHARDCQELEELRRICCEETDRARQATIDELSMHQERNPSTVSQLMAQLRELPNKVNSLSDAREFYDPESGSSSGATHVPDQTSTIFLSPRTLPRSDSGSLRDTQNGTGIRGNVVERPPAQEGLSSTLFNNSKDLASSSQGMRPDTTEITRKIESEMKRKSLNTSVPSPHFQSGSGMMDYPRIPFSEWNPGNFPDSMKFQSWKVNFITEVFLRTADLDQRS